MWRYYPRIYLKKQVCLRCGNQFENSYTKRYCGSEDKQEGRAWIVRRENNKRDSRERYLREREQRNLKAKTPEARAKNRAKYWKRRDKALLAMKARYLRHREEEIAGTRAWQKANPERCRQIQRNRKNRKRQAGGTHTLEEWQLVKALFNYTCPMCLRSEPEIKLTEDHKIPIADGGTNNIDNIQPLCAPCNSRKNKNTMFTSCRIDTRQFLLQAA